MLCTSPTCLLALPGAQNAIEQGQQALASRNFAEALEHFESAARMEPGDAQAAFFTGVALNRLGRTDEALRRFERVLLLTRVAQLAQPHPELDFERGWALLREQQYAQALNVLLRFDQDHPGRGQTAELIARANLGLGNQQAAQRWFALAVERQPALTPTVELGRAMGAERRGNLAVAERHLRNIPAASPVGEYVAENQTQSPAQTPYFWGAALAIGGGDNSSAITVVGNERIAGTRDTDSDFFLRASASGYIGWRSEQWSVIGSAALQTDRYLTATNINQVDVVTGLEVNRLMNDWLSLGIRAQNRHSRVDDRAFLNQFSIGPKLSFRISQELGFNVEYAYKLDRYRDPSAFIRFERDAEAHQINPSFEMRRREGKFRMSIGALFTRTDAEGADFDADSIGFNFQVSNQFDSGLRLRAYLSHEEKRFSEPNTLSNFTSKRHDRTFYVQAHVQYPLDRVFNTPNGLNWYAQIDKSTRRSNIDFYEFDQSIVTTGLVFEF